MREHSLPSLESNGFHRIAYTKWGEPELPGVGHAPALMDAAQVEPIRRFLRDR